MAYSVINIYSDKLNSRRDFLCDDVSDLSNLPTSQTSSEEYPEGVGIGSMALVTEDSSVYVLDNLDTWSELCDLDSGGGGSTPTLIDKEILINGTYDPADDDADGYSSVTVNVPSDTLVSKTIVQNGTYNSAADNADGYDSVTVNVPSDVLVSKSITANGTYNPVDDNADGYSSVNVSVPSDVLVSKTITENGTYNPAADNADGYSSVTVDIEGDVLVSKTITKSGVYNPADDNADGYSSVTVDVFDGMTILKYGISTWADFIDAYNDNAIVYCRASSNANPATGSQTRLAFMAYVNNETTPTEVEFQYYRSVSSHSASQQGDQVYVYKLTKNAGWTVTTRNAFTQIEVGTGLTSSYNNGVLTISLA